MSQKNVSTNVIKALLTTLMDNSSIEEISSTLKEYANSGLIGHFVCGGKNNIITTIYVFCDYDSRINEFFRTIKAKRVNDEIVISVIDSNEK